MPKIVVKTTKAQKPTSKAKSKKTKKTKNGKQISARMLSFYYAEKTNQTTDTMKQCNADTISSAVDFLMECESNGYLAPTSGDSEATKKKNRESSIKDAWKRQNRTIAFPLSTTRPRIFARIEQTAISNFWKK